MPNLLLPAPDEKLLFFHLEGDDTERYGAIGYLRADFGKSGREFWTTWFPSQPKLLTSGFNHEFDYVMNSLREDGLNPPFASRKNLEEFCSSTPGKDLTTRGTGYMIKTWDYSYYIRCLSQPGDYDIYVFAYDNHFLLPELAKRQSKIDERNELSHENKSHHRRLE